MRDLLKPATDGVDLLRRLGVHATKQRLPEVRQLRAAETSDETLRTHHADLPACELEHDRLAIEHAHAGFTFERAEELEVHAMRMKVAALEDVLVQRLLALKEQEPDFSSVLELARALREQVDWDEVRERTRESPFAKAYFTLLDELEIVPA
jgi:hypothetical protein